MASSLASEFRFWHRHSYLCYYHWAVTLTCSRPLTVPFLWQSYTGYIIHLWYVSSVSGQVKYRIWETQSEKEIQEEDLKVGVAFEMYFLDNVQKKWRFLGLWSTGLEYRASQRITQLIHSPKVIWGLLAGVKNCWLIGPWDSLVGKCACPQAWQLEFHVVGGWMRMSPVRPGVWNLVLSSWDSLRRWCGLLEEECHWVGLESL